MKLLECLWDILFRPRQPFCFECGAKKSFFDRPCVACHEAQIYEWIRTRSKEQAEITTLCLLVNVQRDCIEDLKHALRELSRWGRKGDGHIDCWCEEACFEGDKATNRACILGNEALQRGSHGQH